MGHTPFGHIGEDELNKLHSGGFRHNHQSLRIVDKLEKEGKGLNLTWEVRQGILHHSKPRGDFLSPGLTEGMSLEAQVIRISDAVAYLNHDLLDAFRAGVLTETSIPRYIQEILGERHSQRINTMVNDIVTTSQEAMDSVGLDIAPEIKMGVDLRDAVYALREFMFQNVYVPEDKGEEGTTARKIIVLLFGHYHQKKHLIPEDFQIRSETFDDAVKDYISGMTDQYAIRVAESVSPGIAHVFKGRTL